MLRSSVTEAKVSSAALLRCLRNNTLSPFKVSQLLFNSDNFFIAHCGILLFCYLNFTLFTAVDRTSLIVTCMIVIA